MPDVTVVLVIDGAPGVILAIVVPGLDAAVGTAAVLLNVGGVEMVWLLDVWLGGGTTAPEAGAFGAEPDDCAVSLSAERSCSFETLPAL